MCSGALVRQVECVFSFRVLVYCSTDFDDEFVVLQLSVHAYIEIHLSIVVMMFVIF